MPLNLPGGAPRGAAAAVPPGAAVSLLATVGAGGGPGTVASPPPPFDITYDTPGIHFKTGLAGYPSVAYSLVGGGGGGGGASTGTASVAGGGGGGGAFAKGLIPAGAYAVSGQIKVVVSSAVAGGGPGQSGNQGNHSAVQQVDAPFRINSTQGATGGHPDGEGGGAGTIDSSFGWTPTLVVNGAPGSSNSDASGGSGGDSGRGDAGGAADAPGTAPGGGGGGGSFPGGGGGQGAKGWVRLYYPPS